MRMRFDSYFYAYISASCRQLVVRSSQQQRLIDGSQLEVYIYVTHLSAHFFLY
jgi:hypothetical protein